MFPVGVKDVKKYNVSSRKPFFFIKGTPIHVKSGLAYNDMLVYHNLNVEPVSNGEKIKWCYVKKNPFNIETIGLKLNPPKVILDFVEEYIDREKMFNSKFAAAMYERS